MLNITCEATPSPRTREDNPKIVGRGKPATKKNIYSIKKIFTFFSVIEKKLFFLCIISNLIIRFFVHF